MTKSRFVCFLIILLLFSNTLLARTVHGRVFVQGDSCAIPAVGLNLEFSPEKTTSEKTTATSTVEDGTFQIVLNPGYYYVVIYQGGYQVFGDTVLVTKDNLLRFTLRPANMSAISCQPAAMSACTELKVAMTDDGLASLGLDALRKNKKIKEIPLDFKILGFTFCSLKKDTVFHLNIGVGLTCSAPVDKFLELETSIRSCLAGHPESGTEKSGEKEVAFDPPKSDPGIVDINAIQLPKPYLRELQGKEVRLTIISFKL
jgi:hypothetical protein